MKVSFALLSLAVNLALAQPVEVDVVKRQSSSSLVNVDTVQTTVNGVIDQVQVALDNLKTTLRNAGVNVDAIIG
ncbi:hypothetical protein L249_7706 [Ophiocordyceps polyrhachis-furcata BCC 54312]|uniref:Uncharacterized protein n=1 Tax=Ophiocordyceps polyrhachis-furcata BCC 54312 TaxID=1330021 RepID=A0A367L9Z6_9HYPO|nr:hypothetical protein L249_7706 [Ophiocordyceps polyrhachis-furcata BCC 54312]